MTRRHQKQIMFLTAAAAFGSTIPNSGYAFSPVPSILPSRPTVCTFQSQSRLYSKGKDDTGFFGGLKKVAKAILPKSWTQSEEERKADIVRKEMKQELSSNISAVLKDAPLAIRMLGSLVAPIVSSFASVIQEQQAQTQDLLDDARDYILSDPVATAALGEPIMIQQPFSQSSSSVSINGRSSSQVQASFHVEGTRQLGVATMVASDGVIQRLTLNVGGRVMDISLFKSASVSQDVIGNSRSSSRIGKNPIKKSDVIDVEFVDKVEKK